MDLSLREQTFGQEDQTWLDSEHGTSSAITGTIDLAVGFTAGTHWPNGYLPSGTPLGKITATGKYGLYSDAASDGRQTLVGHLFTTQAVAAGATTGNVVGPILTHGRINEAKLPFAIDAAARADVAGRIHYV